MVDIDVRQAEEHDSKTLFNWRNDPFTREMSRDSRPVPWSRHEKWFNKALRDRSRLILICEDPNTGAQVGMVRFDFTDERVQSVISINLAPEMRGKGYAKPCLLAAIAYLVKNVPNCRTILADIKNTNLGSRKSFEGVGFSQATESEGFFSYRMDL